MNRSLLPAVVVAAVLLSLVLAGGAPAMRTSGSTVAPDRAQVARSTAVVEFGNYVVAAGAAYAELSDCACCCSTLDLPTHRCAACRTTATDMMRIVARIRQAQARLARLDVPEPAAGAHADLIAAVQVLGVSGRYMARTVMTDPRSLVDSARTASARHGWRPVWRTSPQVVGNARLAAYLQTHRGPLRRGERLRAMEIAAGPDPGITGPPGEQALAYLDRWRAGVEEAARQLGVTLPVAMSL
jgi:hypothetical protein